MRFTLAFAVAAICSAQALGDVVITQGASAPTYTDYTLNFDEQGGPVGAPIPTDAWVVSHGIAELMSGDGFGVVDDFSATYPWIADGNAFTGNFGAFITWEQDLTAMSIQVWDPSGPGGPFGGGMTLFAFDDGVEVASAFVEPAWGGIGDEWFDFTTSSGDVFDEVRILGWGFTPTTFIDNLSWNVIPEPSSLALLGLAGMALLRRR